MFIAEANLNTPNKIAELESTLESATQRELVDALKAELKLVTGLEYEKCARCGCVTTLGHWLQPSKSGPTCPRCHANHDSRAGIVILFFATMMAIVLVVANVLAAFVGSPISYITVNAILVGVCLIVLVIPHELGHVVATYFVGGGVYEIRFGTGTPLLQTKVGEIILTIGKPLQSFIRF